MNLEADTLLAINNSSDVQIWKLEFDELTFAERVFRVVWGLMGEVDNGGFDQFFFNSSGDTAYFVPDALRAIGALNTAKIVATANSLFPLPHPAPERTQRTGQLDAFDESSRRQLGLLDELFSESSDDLPHLLYLFVKSHLAEIRGAASCG